MTPSEGRVADKQLVDAVLAMDAIAFKKFYALYGPTIRGIAEKSARNQTPPADPDDLEQEIWIAVLHALHQWKPSGKLLHFISRVARRKAVELYRRHSRPPHLEYDAKIDRLLSLRKTDPEAAFLLDLDRCLKRLTKRQLAVLHLVSAGLKAEEMASLLGVQPGTVPVLTIRARRALRECIGIEERRRA